ncbi:hypothetical protein RclHR1_02610002 [Rhizophagus clarus]|uniref:High mobility group protein 20A-like n=1 Tax=Rhizophagus clarus TaxID=94130 RepID=A0A2Z6R1E3_9GLOM|nr:hypothetical protein RclHR1_02610002 [Rhizophagus clarus]GES81216.1 high mobility group protein 20A-like [Rhizophagus clarus]
MSSKSRQKQPTFKAVAANDDLKYKRKYKELKKKIREMEEENEKLSLKLTRAKKNIQRLKIERSFLFDRLEQSQPTNESESDTTSSPPRAIDSEEDLSSSAEELLEDHHRTGKRKKQNRDPNAPKRPRNAFLMYCKSQRDQAREENQNKGFQDVTRILSQKWKDLPNEEKQKYYDMYNKEKERYEIEMSSYVGTSSQFGYIQPEESTRNEVITRFDNNVSNHHHHNDISGERSSLTTAETSRVATTSTLESPYNNNHSYEQYIDENERGIGSEYEEEEFVETKDDVKLDIGGDDYESDTDSEMVDELAADINDNNKRRHSKAEREEAMECEDEVRMEEDDENEKKDNEGEAADSKEENLVNETGTSENDEI